MSEMALLRLLSLLSLMALVSAVDRTKFRTCQDTLFCRTFRHPSSGHYAVIPGSMQVDESKGLVRCSLTDDLHLSLQALAQGMVRVRVTEVSQGERWKPNDLLMSGASASTPITQLKAGDPRVSSNLRSNAYSAYLLNESGMDGQLVLVVHESPLSIDLFKDHVLVLSINSRSLMHYEKTQGPRVVNEMQDQELKDRHQGKEIVDYGEDGEVYPDLNRISFAYTGLAIYADGTKEVKAEISSPEVQSAGWGESFQSHTDSKPDGPKSVGVDIAFPSSQHVYGIPQHTTPLSLPTTTTGSAGLSPTYSDPYRMYTLDVFEYELHQTMALYGNIPFLLAHGMPEGRAVTAAVFWFNPSETFIDISDGSSQGSTFKESHWLSESGDIDVFLMTDSSPMAVSRKFTSLVGTQQLPPLFALGYHQCRWNYRDEKDVADVEAMFEKLDYPYDVLWLDIEHTDGKRYFTWDKALFPNPKQMIDGLSSHGRKMVTIVDPHIKRDNNYPVHSEATSKGYYIKDKNGNDFDGWCWPGSSSYLDFTSAEVRKWWGERFSLSRYVGSTLDLFTWNDMNEPSVFNGPEVSMPKDCRNLAGVEHREWHNLYGLYMQQATALGLTERDPAKSLRPFVLSRAFWAGSQRWGAIWTGDNQANWEHLKIAAPMLLSISVAGLSFVGADVGGFFGDPSAELFTRWYQAGAFTPFFRGHAHHDSKRREPWLFGEPYTSALRSVAILRYSLLPYWYTVFAESHLRGDPVMRPMFFEFPEETTTFNLDDQWMIGRSLLVKPVTSTGETITTVYFPFSQDWYDFESLQLIAKTGQQANMVTVNAPLEKVPVFIRGGSIIPRKLRLRRSSKLMFYDPLTLAVVPDSTNHAFGLMYFDDESTLAHEKNKAYALRELRFDGSSLVCRAAKGSGNYAAPNTIERLVFAGRLTAPTRVFVKGETGDKELEYYFDATTNMVVVKKPDVIATSDWEIVLQ